ncbi:MAG: ATP-binding protein [Parcubacteria group bacterium]|nr:ATP-binding protein [Parcubacteria group bacterium]
MVDSKPQFSFAISLSVLNHLGRNLYRSFTTVLGEAISNSWDADAKNVWIYIDREAGSLVIKDDGVGMDQTDFQEKFLKIGYSKRKDGSTRSKRKRPYIGRKGIGKLALLSCAEKITIISKKQGGEYVGGVIVNAGLDEAIKDDLTPDKYPLEDWSLLAFTDYVKDHEHGTILRFEKINEGIKNSLGYIRKIIALYFRFSLLDNEFDIYINGEKITYEDLNDLAEKTEFLWTINELHDPYLSEKLTMPPLKENPKNLSSNMSIKGFVASVSKPANLKISNTEERVGIDLFVNGRIREKDIMKHMPTARIAESYLYGQIHFDSLDDAEDRFTSSREGIVADDPKYKELLTEFRENVIRQILEDWDQLRLKNRKSGDPENERISRKERTSRDLYNAVSEEYVPPTSAKEKAKVDGWVDALSNDAQYNFTSYAECFISENLLRNYIQEKKVALSKEANDEIADMKKREADNKGRGNVSIDIRRSGSDLSYLSMDGLANLIDKKDPNKAASLSRDAKEYKPVRDAIMHTALLTDVAKTKLTTVYANIKARIIALLFGE